MLCFERALNALLLCCSFLLPSSDATPLVQGNGVIPPHTQVKKETPTPTPLGGVQPARAPMRRSV